MQNLVGYAMALIVIAVALLIGAGIIETTYNTVNDTICDATLNETSPILGAIRDDTGTALETFGGFLPVVIIAGIGAIALGMIMAFGGRMR